MAIEVDEKYGGSHMSFMNVCLSIEELSKVDPTIGLLCDLQNTVVANVFMVGVDSSNVCKGFVLELWNGLDQRRVLAKIVVVYGWEFLFVGRVLG